MRDVLRLNREAKDCMRARRYVVQIVRGKHAILRPEAEQFESLLGRLALEYVQILNNELVLLCPTDPESLLLLLLFSGLLAHCI